MQWATHPSLWEGLGFIRCTPATWKRWANVEVCELWQAIALMLDVDPDEVPYRKLKDLIPFEARLHLALQLYRPGAMDEHEQKPWRSQVRLDDMQTWAMHLQLPLPDRYPVGIRPPALPTHLSPEALEALADLSTPDKPTQPDMPSTRKRKASRKPRSPAAVPSEYLREPDLCAEIAISRATLWRWVKSGIVPQPIKLSPGVTVWRRSDVNEWVAANSQQRNAKLRKRAK